MAVFSNINYKRLKSLPVEYHWINSAWLLSRLGACKNVEVPLRVLQLLISSGIKFSVAKYSAPRLGYGKSAWSLSQLGCQCGAPLGQTRRSVYSIKIWEGKVEKDVPFSSYGVADNFYLVKHPSYTKLVVWGMCGLSKGGEFGGPRYRCWLFDFALSRMAIQHAYYRAEVLVYHLHEIQKTQIMFNKKAFCERWGFKFHLVFPSRVY